ncbi:winged helix-turn-helix transcriptional regulator [Streptomyces massasporeus]
MAGLGRLAQTARLVDRQTNPDAPSRVEYQLTPLRRALPTPIDAVCAWASEYGDEVKAAERQ